MAAIMADIEVTMGQVEELVMDVLRPKLVPFLMSPPGVGKSALARKIANKYKLYVIDIRLSTYDPADLNGFPFILNRDTAQVRAGYVPMNTFPIEGDPLPIGYVGWLILLDEFNSAPLTVQAAAYKLILDRMVGMYRLHPKCVVIAAGNRMIDKAITNRIGTAMQSRVITLMIKVCNDTWHIWADHNEIDHRVKSFLKFKPDLLHRFDPNHQELTFPCPRTWEFTSRIITPWNKVGLEKLPLLAGTVGQGAAREFFSYCEIAGQLPTIEQILQNPEGIGYGDEPSVVHALVGLVAHHMTVLNVDTLMKFIRRLDIDFQVIALRSAIAKRPEIKKTKSISQWCVHHAEELL